MANERVPIYLISLIAGEKTLADNATTDVYGITVRVHSLNVEEAIEQVRKVKGLDSDHWKVSEAINLSRARDSCLFCERLVHWPRRPPA